MMAASRLGTKAAAIAVTAHVALGALFPAAAQQVAAPFSSAQCRSAQNSIDALLVKYRGRMSPELARSLGTFAQSNCDMNTDLSRRPGIDDAAFGEFNLLMVAIRRQQVSAATPQ